MNHNIEDVRWQLNVAEAFTELEARQNIVIQALVGRGYFTVEQFLEEVEELKKEEPYKSRIEEIKTARKALEETPSLSQIFNKFMEGNKDGESNY